LGGALQAQRQNELTANQQLNIQNLNQPLTAAQQYGSGKIIHLKEFTTKV